MASVKKKIVDGRTYYYLEQTIRTEGTVQTEEKYLGTKIPPNVEEIKKQFLSEIYKKKWHPILDRIRENHSREQKKTPATALKKEARSFSVRFTYDTNRIEGSTLTLRETSDLLERGITPKSRPLDDIKETEAHEKLFYEMLGFKKNLSLQAVLYWHKRLFEGTKPDIAGKIRTHQVAISGSKFMPPAPVEVPVLLREFFRWYEKNNEKLHPVELAALAHLKFVTIHPFSDGNGRMSRLLMNFVLNKHGFPLLNIPYEKRNSYYRALERSQTSGNEWVFVQWFFRRYVKEYKDYAK